MSGAPSAPRRCPQAQPRARSTSSRRASTQVTRSGGRRAGRNRHPGVRSAGCRAGRSRLRRPALRWLPGRPRWLWLWSPRWAYRLLCGVGARGLPACSSAHALLGKEVVTTATALHANDSRRGRARTTPRRRAASMAFAKNASTVRGVTPAPVAGQPSPRLSRLPPVECHHAAANRPGVQCSAETRRAPRSRSA